MMKLVIVESPAKCKTIESYLGSSFKCVASFGHIREISDGLKSIDISNNFVPSFSLMKSKYKQIGIIRKLISQSEIVYLATDDDREGEAIAWHICEVFNLPIGSTPRIIFREITKTALQMAIQNPTIVDMNKVNAQKGRQVLDLLVGYSLSPILWKHISANKTNKLSAGRCQTPALRLVYDNQIEIENTPPVEVYDIAGYFTDKDIEFKLNKQIEKKDDVEAFLEDSFSFKHIYRKEEVRQVTKKAPEPFTTSSLQQSVSNEYHYSPKVTMDCCQKLYEGGFITYMRTDSKKYSQEFIGKGREFIDKNYTGKFNESIIEEHGDTQADIQAESQSETQDETHIKKDKKDKKDKKEKKDSKKKKKDDNAQEAHEAIRPTKIELEHVNIDDNRAKNVYKLIRLTTLESLMINATCSSITFKITAPNDMEYRHTEEQIIEPGWKVVRGFTRQNDDYEYLQQIKSNKSIKYNKVYCRATLKNQKSHLSEARLVQLLENHGIGRPSTFSSLISKIQERKYVIKDNVVGKKVTCIEFELSKDEISEIEIDKCFGNEKNKLILTQTGRLVIEFLLKYFQTLFHYDYTKGMEDMLDIIARGDDEWYRLCSNCNNDVQELISAINPNDKSKKKIDSSHEFVIGKYGPVIKTTDEDGKVKFLSVKKDIDISKIKNGEYNLEEIIAEKQVDEENLGKYKGEDLIIKTGKYGKYIVFKGKSFSLKAIDDLTKENIIAIISGEKETNANVLRRLSEHITIRKGKFGPYIFYKTEKMTKPCFYPLKGFEYDYRTYNQPDFLEWIYENLIGS
jgi:DNA topoisomerase I